MESTTKMNALGATGSKILYIIALTAAACIVSRCPVMGDSFICGISFIAYMLSKSTLNIYLILPAAAGLLPYISQGYDPWGYIIAMVICGFVFTGIRKIPLMLWQRGLIAASISIIAVSIYSLAASSVYKTSPEELAAEGMMNFLLIYIFDALYSVEQQHPSSRLPLTAFITVSLMVISGLGLSFIMWPAMIFMVLWVLSCIGAGDAMFAAAAGGLTAYLLGQGQWGLMTTIMLGILAASYAKAHGPVLMAFAFAGACFLAGSAESGVVLGMDKYTLLIPLMLFVVFYWRFEDGMRKFMNRFAGENVGAETEDTFLENILKDKSSQMSDLTELYSTYLDSRAVMANQFNLTRQIIDDIRWLASKQGRRAASRDRDRFGVDIAISQCAASGVINGDCCGWQDLGDGRVVMVVSDGMGKGKKAAAESLMVTRTMISLLKSGATVDLALKMINTIMLMKDNEDSYATLDMVTVDKQSGKAKFYKIGAAPTLIRRRSNVEEVKLSAVPLGIVNGLKVRYVETTLKKNDWIIMMSDGVSDGGLQKIKETTADVRSADPQTMSDLIMNRAADSYIGRERDDMTVMVARIL
ncbi:MAG: SpoIIE family protein phosphatase [Firmicutes bacterium]|nr:SpoIIE family protein phosphatase [Bacillota bacterium]